MSLKRDLRCNRMLFCHLYVNYLDKFWFYLMKLWQIKPLKLRPTRSVSHINHISVKFAPNIKGRRVKHVKLIRSASQTKTLSCNHSNLRDDRCWTASCYRVMDEPAVCFLRNESSNIQERSLARSLHLQ